MKKLVHRLKEPGAWGFVRLVLWARENRSDGDFSGLTDEDLELAVDWHGDAGLLITTLFCVGFIDGTENERRLHDWEDHQPWSAGQKQRSESAKWSALVRHEGFDGAKAKMPDYYETHKDRCETHANRKQSDAKRMQSHENAPKNDAPSPSPSPSPSPIIEGAVAPPKLPLASQVEAETQDEPPPQKKKKGVARARNDLLDALAVLSGGSVETVTGSMWGAAAKALSEIKAVCPDVTPEMISAAAAAYRREWPKVSVSPSALAKNWSKFAPGAKKQDGRTVQGVQEPTWNWREAARELGLCAEHWAMLERADKIKILRKQMEGVKP